MKILRREYSNISLTNALEIYVPRGQTWKLINIREVERKSTKKSSGKCNGGLTWGPVAPVRRKMIICIFVSSYTQVSDIWPTKSSCFTIASFIKLTIFDLIC